MKAFEVSPLEPLVFGDGRPFSTEAGAQAAGGRALPMPSTFAGGIRTAIGRQGAGAGSEPDAGPDWDALAQMPVHGPLLLDQNEVLAPTPADMAIMRSGGTEYLVRLRPGRYGEGEGSDLPQGLQPLVFPSGADALEPSKSSPPQRLTIQELSEWYGNGPLWGETPREGTWRIGGWGPWRERGVATESRVHVGINPETLTHGSGLVYETRASAFGAAQRLLGRAGQPIEAGVTSLGGERRLASLAPGSESRWTCPDEIATGLRRARRIAMALVTPAHFEGGAMPFRLAETLGGDVRIVAAATRRRSAVSGWDLVRRCPKPVRWLVPEGSVFYLEVEAPTQVFADRWLTPVSDLESSRRDGFGLAMFFPTDW